MRHTPGPWNVMLTPSGYRFIEHYPNGIRTEENVPIAQLVQDERDGIDPEANARLIAAAPELLDALKDVAQMLECGDLVRDISKDGSKDFAIKMLNFIPRLNKIMLAIAKAEGK